MNERPKWIQIICHNKKTFVQNGTYFLSTQFIKWVSINAFFLSLFTEYQLIRCNSSSLWNAKPENPYLYILKKQSETIKRFWKCISELKIANKGSKIRLKCRHFELWKVWFSMYLLKLMEKRKESANISPLRSQLRGHCCDLDIIVTLRK